MQLSSQAQTERDGQHRRVRRWILIGCLLMFIIIACPLTAIFVIGRPDDLRTLGEMLLALVFVCGALGFIIGLFGQIAVDWQFHTPSEQRTTLFSILCGVAAILINLYGPILLRHIGFVTQGVITGIGLGCFLALVVLGSIRARRGEPFMAGAFLGIFIAVILRMTIE
jgi:hypothetical protein